MEQPAERMTVAEYLAASATWEVRHEWVNGEILAMSGGRPRHAAVIQNVAEALGSRLRGGPCRAASSDLRVHIPDTGAWLYPDLTVICGPWETAPDDPITVTNPSVIVEVLSPTTADYDRGAKVEHYRRLPSVTDMLLIDPDVRHVTHLRRTDEGWLRMDRADGDIELRTLGISVPVESIYADLEHVPDA